MTYVGTALHCNDFFNKDITTSICFTFLIIEVMNGQIWHRHNSAMAAPSPDYSRRPIKFYTVLFRFV